MSSTDLILARLDKARLLLAEARDATDAKRVSDLARAAEIYAKRQRLGEESIRYAHTIVIDAQRLLGEFLAQAERNPGSRSQINGAGPGRGKTGGTKIEPPVSAIPTLASAGITKKESSQAQMIARVAEASPERFEALRSGKLAFAKLARESKREEQNKRIRTAQSMAKPKVILGPFDLILADPPWRYEGATVDGSREIENQYPTASLEQIFTHFDQAEVNPKKESILFLWATAPKLDESLQVMRAWRFDYRSCAVWDKEKIGMGYWWRIQHELLLVGVRGNPSRTPECERISSIFREPRTSHSRKPECIYAWIERAFPAAVKLEMYQRTPRPGWAGWGNEAS